MTSTLEELRDRLYKVFDTAANRADSPYTNDSMRAENSRAVAALAGAIVQVDTRIEEKEGLKSASRLPGKP